LYFKKQHFVNHISLLECHVFIEWLLQQVNGPLSDEGERRQEVVPLKENKKAFIVHTFATQNNIPENVVKNISIEIFRMSFFCFLSYKILGLAIKPSGSSGP